jgi:glycosyltransferase involved in cell wall biosynthesis
MSIGSDPAHRNGYRPKVAIAMRSYNDRDVIRGTLEMIRRQHYPDFVLWNFDSSSTDGTFEIMQEYNDLDRIRQNDASSYNPGRVLNEAVSTVGGDVVVFINSDATPESEDWLEQLIAPLADTNVGTVYGRQTPREDCRSLFVKDTSGPSATDARRPPGCISSRWQTRRRAGTYWSASHSKPGFSTPRTSSGPTGCARRGWRSATWPAQRRPIPQLHLASVLQAPLRRG